MDGEIFDSEPMLEWEHLGTHGVLLGKPWLARYNPAIDWRTHQMTFAESLECQEVEENELRRKLRQKEYAEFFHVNVRMGTMRKRGEKKHEAMPEIKVLLEEFQDVFPGHLPDKLLPKKNVEIES
ncbi:uncharacterized protein PHALS_12956 [Plasmopara halstedii]|uniref:Uncharacterized protein n=1 Tax=Plasmopara halstedii TaxID=4781 RepID=A0A0P1AN99_PLAHL|nr:uncharacterized protein PHALS_12956 [Plasmopara halstedii]CEG42702.1 hypothetical protein PHALS_12956 [Plasmopara halstedii]|eukprot:XP_024579071.1 hypothetical protein PHALS_12956 [Plasmopara halstedii]